MYSAIMGHKGRVSSSDQEFRILAGGDGMLEGEIEQDE